MTQQIIGIGSAPNDNTGDLARDAFQKVNQNFTEVYGFVQTVNGQPGPNPSLNATDVGADTSGAAATAETNAKAYADGLQTGVVSDRGGFDASGNVFPTTGGSGTSGAIKRANRWYITVGGTLGGVAVSPGDEIQAKIDAPGNTLANWIINSSTAASTVPNASTSVAGKVEMADQSEVDNGTATGTVGPPLVVGPAEFTGNKTYRAARQALTVVSNAVTPDMAGKQWRKFYTTTTITANVTFNAPTNAANFEELEWHFKITGSPITITFPAGYKMMQSEKDAGRWNDSTRVLSLTPTIADAPFRLLITYDGSVYKVEIGNQYV